MQVSHLQLYLEMYYTFFVLSSIGICYARLQPFPVFKPLECTVTTACNPEAKFRTMDGSCTNLKHPSWGQSHTPYIRTLAARYQEKDVIRKGVNGQPLPNERNISLSIFPDRIVPDKLNTLDLMQFGQVLSHDIGNLVFRTKANGKRGQCCTADYKPTSDGGLCFPIEVSARDPFYKQFNVQCMTAPRGKILDSERCPRTDTEPENENTHVIDASLFYGSDEETAKRLRTTNGDGKLRVEFTQDGRPFPPSTNHPTLPCHILETETVCYDSGDNRVNQNTDMTLYHILYVRLHNLIVDQLHKINPQWDGERLYQETRKLIGAAIQHLTYKHFLPEILGESYVKQKGLSTGNNIDVCFNYYDPKINPSAFAEFSGAAFRSFHSLVPQKIKLVDKNYKTRSEINLDDYFFQPTITQQPGVLDYMLRGMASQRQETQDQYMSVALTQYYFKGNFPTREFGVDLSSIDIFRNRDLGLPTYNDMRKICGLKRARDFCDFADVMSQESIKKLQKLYNSHEDIDLFVGGMMENLLPNTLVGPTFQCIIGEQFYHIMRGDRFYYENCGLPNSFTKDQLRAIYNVSLAWAFCKTGDNIETMPLYTFHVASKKNPILPCNEIPILDLTLWKE